MERWTMEELESTDDISFAISMLNQRRNGLNPFSPLSMKLQQATATLERIKEETDKYIARISAPAVNETYKPETEDQQ